jgi:tetratricopeptide (TPR) repeat protein
VLEAASARLDDGDIPAARTLLEFACGRVRAHQPADAFDTAWHAAALTVIEGVIDPIALEAHVQHSRSHLPGDPLLDLAWAIAAEQRASPLLAPQLPLDTSPVMLAVNQARLDASIARIIDDAIERFAKAIANPQTAAEARVRTAHVRLMRHEAKEALDVLAGTDTGVREAWVAYLARLFRGQALEQLARPDEAARAFSDALKIGPGGQSATLSLASLLFRRGQRDNGAALAQQVLAETDPISDPWWTYWAGSARLWTSRRAAMRGAIQ